jgi:hypothetical protein
MLIICTVMPTKRKFIFATEKKTKKPKRQPKPGSVGTIEYVFTGAKKLLNDPGNRIRISKKFGNANIFHGATFWMGKSVHWPDHTGNQDQLETFLNTNVDQWLGGQKKIKYCLIDVATSPRGCAHYAVLVLHRDPYWCAMFDSGSGTDKQTYPGAQKKIRPALIIWLKKRELFSRHLGSKKNGYDGFQHFLAALPLQRNKKDTMCMAWSLWFRSKIQSKWSYDDIVKLVVRTSQTAKHSQVIEKFFKRIFKTMPSMRDQLKSETNMTNAVGVLQDLTLV